VEVAQELPVVAVLRLEAPSTLNVRLGPSSKLANGIDPTLEQWLQEETSVSSRYLGQIRAGQTLRLGRSKVNDVVLEDSNVSRFHAVMTASESGVVLSDLSSLNGTFVNERRISMVNLRNGDRVNLGESQITLDFKYASKRVEGENSEAQTQSAGMKVIDVTVLLVDICGYTKMSQALPAADVAKALQAWFQIINGVIKQHGGEIDKYIGDCAMALWRGQHYSQQGALAACQAAREILAKTEAFSQSSQWDHQDSHPWRCRAAINSGSALAGSLGTREAREFTVLGDSINVAFRLESVAGQFQTTMILGAQTAALVQPQLTVRTLGSVELEGRVGEETVYTLTEI
jgi:adenylate cyclase